MKTQILQLDAHDDIISTRDKLGWKQTGRVLLVWPQKGRVLTRQIDLVLLARHTASLGAQIALITRDPEVRANAHLLGISVFKTPEEAQTSRWERPQHWRRRIERDQEPPLDLETLREQARPSPPAWLELPWVRFVIFLLGVMAVLAVAALLFPSAQIVVDLPVENISIDLPVEGSREIDQVNLAGVLPIEVIEIVVEGRETRPVSGSALVDSTAAVGSARFTNLSIEDVEVPRGTVVRTLEGDPVRFATTRNAIVPAESESGMLIPIQAIQAGREGNLNPGEITAVEGPLGLNLRVTNPEPTRGGSSQRVSSVSANDQQALRQALSQKLRETSIVEFMRTIEEGDLLLTSEPRIKDILEESYSAEINDPLDNLELTLRIAYEFEIIPAEAIRQLTQAALNARLTDNQRPLPNRLTIIHDPYPVIENEENPEWELKIQQDIQTVPDFEQLAARLAGYNLADAQAVIAEEAFLIEPIDVHLSPAWWPRLPFLPFRIHFVVRE